MLLYHWQVPHVQSHSAPLHCTVAPLDPLHSRHFPQSYPSASTWALAVACTAALFRLQRLYVALVSEQLQTLKLKIINRLLLLHHRAAGGHAPSNSVLSLTHISNLYLHSSRSMSGMLQHDPAGGLVSVKQAETHVL